MTTVKNPAVAGLFYPSDPSELRTTVDRMLSSAKKVLPADAAQEKDRYAKAVMAPHAGYVYSGEIAAHAYQTLDPDTKRVLVIGPTHRVGIEGMALTGADIQRTPLGDIPTDDDLTLALELHPDVITAPIVHAQEHSIEVHLPFLQRYLNGPFTVVPLAVGTADPRSVAEAIEVAATLPDTAVVVSSDMSHFLRQEQARAVDSGTLEQIIGGHGVTPDQACGAYSVNGMTEFAKRAGLEAELLAKGDSGDTSGDTSSVVGYAAMAWHTPEDLPETEAAKGGVFKSDAAGGLGDALTWMAQATLARALGLDDPAAPTDQDFPELSEPGACFVTLEKDGRLRGCVGSLVPGRALAEDVVHNALAAAFHDSRFSALTAEELPSVDVEVSVLGRPRPLKSKAGGALTEQEVLDALTPGEDGVILEWGPHRATFLPQVWEQLPEPHEFLSELKLKAGLPPDFWAEDVAVKTYPVTAYHRPAGGEIQ